MQPVRLPVLEGSEVSVELVYLVCGVAHGECVAVQTTEDGQLPRWCKWREQMYYRHADSKTYVYQGEGQDDGGQF